MVKNIPVLFMGAGAEACKKTGAGQEQTGSATLLIGFRTKLCLIIFWYRYGEVARSEAKCTGTGIEYLKIKSI